MDIVVLTTAALPWRTGPSLFSIWHAGGLADLGYRVAYGIPWLGASSQRKLWGRVLFQDQSEQAQWLRDEARRLGIPPLPDIFFFNGVFSKSLFSIFVTEDPFAAAPPARFFLVQEPEHFGWLPTIRPKERTGADKIVGIVMTNYGHYIRRPGRPDRSAFAWVVENRHKRLMRKHAHVIVPLSPALDLSGLEDMTEWRQVTGILPAFAEMAPPSDDCRGVYFLGRLTWDKGLDTVIETAKRLNVPMDIYGDGPDQDAIRRKAAELQSPVRFLGPSDSPWQVLADYRVFFNPSLSEVLCSTTAEALAAGRHVVIPDCPANQPFYDLPNVHVYTTPQQADDALRRAMTAETVPPTMARQRFDWRAVSRSVAQLLER
ncbi:MAG: glycosyltransferase [Magnetospirillum sp.]